MPMTPATQADSTASAFDLPAVLGAVQSLLAASDGTAHLGEWTLQATRAIGFEAFGLFSLEHRSLVLEAQCAPAAAPAWHTLRAVQAIAAKGPRAECECIVQTLTLSPHDADLLQLADLGFAALAIVPLVAGGRCVGVLVAASARDVVAEAEVQLPLCVLASALGAVIDRRRQTFMTFSGDAITLHGVDGVVIDANPQAGVSLGRACDDLIGMTPGEMNPSVTPERRVALREAVRQHGTVEFESTHCTASGREFPVAVRMNLVALGDRAYTVVVARDVSVSKAAEEALRRSQALLELAHDIGAFGSYDLDLTTGRVLLSDNHRPMFGLEDTTGDVPLEALLVQPHLRELVERLRDTPVVITSDSATDELELRGRKADGSPRVVQVRRRGIVDESGAKIRVVGTVQDISERRLAEEALARSEAMMQRGQRMGQIGSWVCDLETRTVTLSAEGARLRGLTGLVHPADVLISRMHADDREAMRPMMEAVHFGGSFETEYRMFLPGESQPRHVRTIVEAEKDASGKVVRLIGITQDITARHELESQLRHAQKQEVIGRLAGGVAHDFNNLLTIINGLGESLTRQLSDRPAVVEDLRAILEAGRRAATLTRQLLAVSRRQLMEPRVLDLNTVVIEAESLLRRTISAHVSITHHLAADLPAVRVDRGQLEQVIMNLVLNARDAMPVGGVITLTTRVREVAAGAIPDVGPGAFVVLSVSDTGVGMPADTLSRVFEPFFTTKPLGQGTGLGLAMVQGIVSQSGGYVQAESQPGRGTTVHIGLPATDDVLTGDERALVEAVTPGTGTVLLVEDEDGVRRLTQRVLAANGYTVIVAESGEAAMALPASVLHSADLLLTDIMMPGMTGAELATALRREQPDLPVIFMSGYASDALDVEQVPGSFLQKPFRIDDLAAAVRGALLRT